MDRTPRTTPDRDHPAGSLVDPAYYYLTAPGQAKWATSLAHGRLSSLPGVEWDDMPTSPADLDLHPAIAAWFADRFPEGPTEAQAQGWPLVQSGSDVLIAAPTGSGKTLAGFLMAIDQAYRAHQAGERRWPGVRGSSTSPRSKPWPSTSSKTSSARWPRSPRPPSGSTSPVAPITVAVRTGDTPSSARVGHGQGPSDASSSPRPRASTSTSPPSGAGQTLTGVRTVIVDEIHALARDKRGSHLALSLERLEHVQQEGRPQRVGLSATQRPIEVTARISAERDRTHVVASAVPGLHRQLRHLAGTPDPRQTARAADATRHASGAGPGPACRRDRRHVEIVDCGHRRDLRVSIELPEQELAAVLSQEQLGEIVQRIAAHVKGHQTTLVFVNTRRLSERLAHLLGETPRA